MSDDCTHLKSSFDGKSFDLTPLAPQGTDFKVATGSGSIYLNLCRSISNATSTPSRAYLHPNGTESGHILATSTGTLSRIPDSMGTESLVLPLEGGEKCQQSSESRSVIVYFRCVSQTSNSKPSLVYENGCVYFMSWPSYNACPLAADGGRQPPPPPQPSPDQHHGMGWFGTTMLVLFIGYVLYFIAAVFYKRRQGERGMDQIPNIEFWRRLFGRFRGSSSRQQYRNVGASGGVGDYHITLVDDDELFSE